MAILIMAKLSEKQNNISSTWLLLLLGLIFVFGTLFFERAFLDIQLHKNTALGKIIAIEKHRSFSKGGTRISAGGFRASYVPVVLFKDENNNDITASAFISGTTDSSRYETEKIVEIAYSSTNKQNIMIYNDTSPHWFILICGLSLGLFFLWRAHRLYSRQL